MDSSPHLRRSPSIESGNSSALAPPHSEAGPPSQRTSVAFTDDLPGQTIISSSRPASPSRPRSALKRAEQSSPQKMVHKPNEVKFAAADETPHPVLKSKASAPAQRPAKSLKQQLHSPQRSPPSPPPPLPPPNAAAPDRGGGGKVGDPPPPASVSRRRFSVLYGESPASAASIQPGSDKCVMPHFTTAYPFQNTLPNVTPDTTSCR